MTKLNSLSKLALVVSAVAAFSIGCSNSPPATTSTTSSGGSSSGGTTSGGSSSGGSSSGGTTGTSTGGAALTLTPNTQAFGSVAQGASSTATVFTVKNAGTGVSGPVSVTVTGNNAGDFVPSANTCTGTLAVNATCTVSITFSPSGAGNEAATLTATATPGGSASASLSGSGVAPGGLLVNPSSYPFGTVTDGQASTAQTFTFTNTGASTTATPIVTMFGGDAAQFQIASASNTCTAGIAANGTCSVSVTFNPTAAGAFASAVQLSVGSTAAENVSAAVTGTGVAGAHLSVSPLAGAFGTQVIAATSSPVTFTVTNQGGVATAALVDSPLTGANAADFAIGTDGCSGQILQPLATCQLQITFTPSVAGPEAGILTVADGATDTVTVDLAGAGAAAAGLSIAPSPAAFSSPIGTVTSAQTFTVTNAAGSVTSGILKASFAGSNPGDFAIVTGSDGCTGTTLAGGATCTISVTFTPTLATEQALLNVAGTPGGTASATLNGTGIAPASLSPTPPSLSFGSIADNTPSASKTITITNPGGVATGTPQVTLGGANAGDFTMTNGCTAPLAAGTGSCTISVIFTPTLVGNEVGNIVVTATPGGSITLGLSGSGITPSSLAFDTGSPTDSPSAMQFYFEENDLSWPTTPDNHGGPATFTIINNGSQATGALTIGIGTGAFHGDFTVVAPTGSDCVSGTTSLATGQTCTIRVEFQPIDGDLSGSGAVFMQQDLVITPTSGAALTASLSGYGINLLSYNSTVFAEGSFNTQAAAAVTAFSTPTGVGESLTFTYYNQTANDDNEANDTASTTDGTYHNDAITEGTPTLTGDTTDFVITGGSCHAGNNLTSVGGGGHNCTVTVTFTPTTSTPANATASLSLVGSTIGTAVIQSDTFALTGSASSPLTVQADTLGALNTYNNVTTYDFSAGGASPTNVGASAVSGQTTPFALARLRINCAVANCGLVRASLDDQVDFAVVTNGAADNANFSGNDGLTIAFVPKAAGSYTQHLTLTGAAGYTATVTLTGTATTPSGVTGSVSVAPSSNNFGLQSVGTESALETFTITNGLASAVQLSSPPVEFLTAGNTVDTSGNFTVSYPSSSASCFTGSGLTGYAKLLPGGTCQLQVAFTPPASTLPANLGVNLTDTLQLLTNPSNTTAIAAVSGTPTSPLSISLTSGTDPMLQHVGDSPASSETFTVKNNGAAITLNTTTYAPFECLGGPCSATNLGHSGATVLTETTSGTADTCTGTLAAGGTCTVTVSMVTTAAGIGYETFTVQGSAGVGVSVSSPTINGTVLAVANLTISPTPFDFGSQAVGSSTPAQTFTVTNTGGTATGNLSTSSSITQYAISADLCSGHPLAAGATCTFGVTFTPTAVSTSAYENQTITVTDAAVVANATVNGNGVGVVGTTGELTITPPWYAFPNEIEVADAGPTATFTVHNPATGVASVTLNTAGNMINTEVTPPTFQVVTGTGAGTCVPAGTLAAGSSCTIVVQEVVSIPAGATGTAQLLPAGSPGTATYAALTGFVQSEEVLAPANGTAFTFGPTITSPTTPNVSIGTSASKTFPVTNTGAASATLGTAVLTSLSGPAVITITADTCSGTILPGAGALPVGSNKCSITVTFSPTTLATSTAALSISGTDGAGNKSTAAWGTVTPPVAGITGIGFPDATLTISPVDAGFLVSPTTDNDGGLILGDDYSKDSIGSELVYTVYNDGGVVSAPLSVTLPAAASTATPPVGALFYVDENNSTCYGSGGGTIYVGGDAGLPSLTGCTLSVDMHAAINSPTGLNSATFQVNATSGDSNVVNVFGNVFGPVLNQGETTTFAGTGTASSPYDFGTWTVGEVSTNLVVNIGNISLGYTTGLLETSLSDQTDFTITSDTCAGATLGSSGTLTQCTIDVVFNPASGSVSPATVTVTDTASPGAGSISFSIQGNP